MKFNYRQKNFVEIQLPAEKFTRLLWHRLYDEEICDLNEFIFPSTKGSSTILDHVTFPEQPKLKLEDSQTSIVIRVNVFLRSAECLSHDCQADEYVGLSGPGNDAIKLELAYLLTPKLDITTNPAKPTARLCMALDTVVDIESGIQLPQSVLPTALMARLANIPCTPIPIDAIESALPATSSISQVGISTNLGETRLAIRMEVNGPRVVKKLIRIEISTS